MMAHNNTSGLTQSPHHLNEQGKPVAVVIDDDQSSQMVTAWLLTKANYNVIAIKNSTDLASLLANNKQPINVFVIDYLLNDETAFDIFSILNKNQNYASVAKVVITSTRSNMIERQCIDHGAADVITKPFNKQTFATRVRIAHRLSGESLTKSHTFLDPLTQALSRFGLFSSLIHNNQISPCNHSFVLFEISNLDQINNIHGREQGDAALIKVKEAMEGVGIEQAIVARISTRQFAVALPTADQGAIHQACLSIQKNIRNINNSKHSSCIAFHMGTAALANTQATAHQQLPDASVFEHTLTNAAIALRQAKVNSSDLACHFDAAVKQNVTNYFHLENEIYSGLVGRTFEVNYQPLVATSTQMVVGYEALLRYTSPNLGTVNPQALVMALENTGYMPEFGLLLLTRVLRDMQKLPATISVAINVAPVQLQQADFAEQFIELVNQHGINPKQLEIELTETSALDIHGVAKRNIEQLVSMGCRLALDDFGIGNSNLNYLLQLPVSKIKLDKNFVRNYLFDKTSTNIIKSVIYLVKLEEIDLLVEGIETEEQHTAFCALEVPYAQGYFYGKPAPASQAFNHLLN